MCPVNMRFDIITIFPEALESYLNTSILKRATERGLISVRLHGLRKWGKGGHKQLDDKPYGGGAGMVLQALPILKAMDSIRKPVREPVRSKPRYSYDRKNTRNTRPGEQKIVILSAKGKQFNQKMAYDWARRCKRLVLISGRYEGIDERVRQILNAAEVSVGPYVLTDGDTAAMVIISAISRLIPGVIKLESLQEESHWNRLVKREAARGTGDLEYPHYTRPEVITWGGKRYRVPKILLSGDHRSIAAWRAKLRR